MNSRPILFQGAMVRALLDGSKTQTRRIIKRQPELPRAIYAAEGADTVITPTLFACENGMGLGWQFAMTKISGPHGRIECLFTDYEPIKSVCPYGKLGDQLWVRETCFINDYRGVDLPEDERADCQVVYKADPLPDWEGEQDLIVWRPSIHMPRWASRITLEITGVRVERLQDISEADAIAEGVERHDKGWWKNYTALGNPLAYTHLREARASYSSLWVSINGPGSWDANPWVWVVEFKVIKP